MIEDIIEETTILKIRKEIEDKKGVEVFFVGKRESSGGRIVDIKACAWGNDNAVPVVFEEAYKGDYLLHNHPSGNLKPSSNDINLAAHFSSQGIGFLIINNEVSNYNTVVPAVDVTKISLLDNKELTSKLEPGGEISVGLKEYEYRESQLEMLNMVCNSFNEDSVGIFEAGTGTGKSLAYLVPAIYWAIVNKEKIVISTNTINLQEQLIKKDIPFIKKVLNLEFKAVLVKGRSNYACLRKVSLLNDGQELFEEFELENKNEIIEWANKAKTGSKDELGFIPSPSLWEKVSSERDLCIKNKCPYFKECFFYKARKEMTTANLLIVNHHLLCSDISIRKSKSDYTTTALLPAYTKVIIDEAHNLEDTAASYFGTQVSRLGLKRAISKVYRKRKKNPGGLLPFLLTKIRNYNVKYPGISEFDKIVELIHKTIAGIVEVSEIIDKSFDILHDFGISQTASTNENKLRLLPDFHKSNNYLKVVSSTKRCSSAFREISLTLKRIFTLFEDIGFFYKEEILGEIHEVEAYADRFDGYSAAIDDILSCSDNTNVYWMEFDKKGKKNKVYLKMCPIEVGELIRDYLFIPINTTVLTSATLSAGGNFEFFKSRIGLNVVSNKNVFENIFDSPFNYNEQAMLCVPDDIVEPNSPSFVTNFCNYAKNIVEVTHGATFFLCTSFKQIRTLKMFLLDSGDFDHIDILCQGDMDRSKLLKRFKSSRRSILIGTDSFWEGVDVPGDALKCVVIVKLPFRVPSEPLYQARAEKLEAEGRSAFFHYALPISIIKFKQGFGRLIRSSYDEGVVICLDKRLRTKQYGRYFIESLPELPVVFGESEDILSNVKKFFR